MGPKQLWGREFDKEVWEVGGEGGEEGSKGPKS